jgi:type I restriction enzyme M protein
MDRYKDKIGCEFPFTKIFYVYKPLRERSKILEDLFALDKRLEEDLIQLKKEL